MDRFSEQAARAVASWFKCYEQGTLVESVAEWGRRISSERDAEVAALKAEIVSVTEQKGRMAYELEYLRKAIREIKI